MAITDIIATISANNYLRALAIFLVFYVSAELVKFISERIFLRLAKKTKTTLDDDIIKKTRKPASLLLILIGVRIGLSALQLDNGASMFVAKVNNSFIAIVIIYLIVGIVKILLDHWKDTFAKRTKSTVDDHLVIVLKKAMTAVFVVATALTLLDIWGIEIGPLLAGLGIGGLAIAFALQKSLGNVFGGISMILDKSIQVGEVVVLDENTKGTILDIGLRSTKIRTFDNEVIIIPNGKLEDMMIQNVVKPEPAVRVVIPFGVAYGSDIAKVKKIILKEIAKLEGLDKTEGREAIVRFREMGDSALLFKAYFWVDTYKIRFASIDTANELFYNALNKAKIGIPFPQMDVWIKEHRKRAK